ncbi:MAG: sigma-54 interaction domain-containing protein [bacterium]
MSQNSENGQVQAADLQRIQLTPGKQLNFLEDQLSTLEMELRSTFRFEFIVGHHPKMVNNLKLVSQIADTDATVLVQGESGTGKELIARALHCNSGRQDEPFVPINCGALPESLLESELFGHVRGAFTGAISDKPGWFERANGGTIFLDEVSEMTPALQVKLLRILQAGDYSPVGSTENRKCDVRIIAATNKDLLALVHQERFREDLYYRLNVIDIEVPPLRDRKSDIPLLTQHFINVYSAQYGKENLKMSRDTQRWLLSYAFPGNVRELENIIQRCVALVENNIIQPQHLPPSLNGGTNNIGLAEKHSSFRAAKQRVVEKFEQEYIVDCLKASQGNVSRAAKSAGIDVKNFHVKMRKYGIDAHAFKMPTL